MRSHVDLPTLVALQAEWQDHPPVHHLVAAYLGYKPPDEIDAQRDQSLQQLFTGATVNTTAPKLDSSAWQQAMLSQPEPPNHG